MGFSVNGSAYENRREGDRIIQDAGAPIRNNQYNAYAYSPDTFPPASPPVIAAAIGRGAGAAGEIGGR